MPTTTANTLVPPAVRVAKVLGTVGAAYAAGAYLTTASHVLPTLPRSSSRDLAVTLANLRKRLSNPLLILTSTSATALAYTAYYLYSTPDLMIPLASVAFEQGSFLPHAEAKEIIVRGGWELYAAAATALGAVVPWHVVGLRAAEKRIESAGEAADVANVRNFDKKGMENDVKGWQRGLTVAGVLTTAGALVGAYAGAWW